MHRPKYTPLSPEIDKHFDYLMGKALRDLEKLEDASSSVVAMVRLLEGERGLIGQIAVANNYKFKSTLFSDQIAELSEKRFIPKNIKNNLNFVRSQENIVKHPDDRLNNFKLEDAIQIREQVLSIMKWFYCECDKGPKHKHFFLPTLVVAAQVGHRRTILGLSEIDDNDNIEIRKMKVLDSDDFLRERGRDLFRCALSIFTNSSSPSGYAISLSCPTDRDGRLLKLSEFNYWPSDIVTDMKLNPKTLVLNDAVAFAFAEDINQNYQPTLVLTLGSGVGCAVARIDQGLPLIKPIELGETRYTMDKNSGSAHQLLGWKYFVDLHKDPSYDYSKIVSTYTGRVAELIYILKKTLLFDSVLLGGGRSVYVSSDILKRDIRLAGMPIHILSDEEHIIRALAKAWTFKFQENHNFYDTR